MHNWFDQFVKEVLHEAFDALGTARQEVEVSADAQRIDFFFVPDPAQLARPPGAVGSPHVPSPEREAPAEPAQVPPIFARMARTACLLEHYGRPPDIRGLRGCLRKQLTQAHLDDIAAAGAAGREAPPPGPRSFDMPILWVLSAGRPADVVSGFSLRRLQGWPTGTYQGPLPALPYRMIVLNELPENRYTLPLRLLGRGATFRRAMQELKKLPPETWERRHIPRLLVRLRLDIPEAAPLSDLPPEEKELLVTVDEYLQQVEEKGRQQGVQQGIQQGVQQGIQQGVQQGIQQGVQQGIQQGAQQGQQAMLLRQCTHRLGRTLSNEERARFIERLATLGPDRLGDLVLDFSAAELAAWLSDPVAK